MLFEGEYLILLRCAALSSGRDSREALLRPVLGITSVNCTRLTRQTCTVPSALGQMIRKMGRVIFRNTELCNTVTRSTAALLTSGQ